MSWLVQKYSQPWVLKFFWQVEVDVADREKKTFTTRHGLCPGRVAVADMSGLPGRCNHLWSGILRAPGAVKRSLQTVPPGRSLKPSKCFLLRPIVPYLGHVVFAKGASNDPAKIEAVQQWPVSLKVTDVRSFPGLASYYRRFIQTFSEITEPLHRLTAKATEKFKWRPDCDLALRVPKQKLVSAPVLASLCVDRGFIMDCDALTMVWERAVMSHRQDGDEKVIAYASRVLEDRERWYSTTKKEMLAMVYAINHFRHCRYERPSQLGRTMMHLNSCRASKSPMATFPDG